MQTKSISLSLSKVTTMYAMHKILETINFINEHGFFTWKELGNQSPFPTCSKFKKKIINKKVKVNKR